MSGSLFYNYKNYFSIVLLAIVDVNYKFIYIDVGAFGKESDSTIFEKSNFFKKLENNELNIPKTQSLPGTNTKMPYIFIGDEAFSLSSNVMRHFSGRKCYLTRKEFLILGCLTPGNMLKMDLALCLTNGNFFISQ